MWPERLHCRAGESRQTRRGCCRVTKDALITQVIGPNSTPYHKSCLVCTACNKRLDSTLLVEHDGLPVCRNCHRSHLGQGKGGFAKAVPVRATLPTSPPRRTLELDDKDQLASSITGISISSRGTQSPPTKAATPLHSVDDAIASGSQLPTITPKSAALRQHMQGITQAVNGDSASRDEGGHTMSVAQSSSRRLPSPVRRTPVSSPANNYKTANSDSPRTPSTLPGNGMASSPFRNQYSSPASTPSRLGNAIGSGTPLCARCRKPAYFAEAVQGATTGGRVWHRACLKCEGCGTTLQKGTLEEGPPEEADKHGQGMGTFCKACYKRFFGPRGIGNAGTSFPTAGR